MNMIILNQKEVDELEAINTQNLNLHRAIKPLHLGDDKFGVNCDILSDKVTWGNWIDFLSEKPTEDVEIFDSYPEELES